MQMQGAVAAMMAAASGCARRMAEEERREWELRRGWAGWRRLARPCAQHRNCRATAVEGCWSCSWPAVEEDQTGRAGDACHGDSRSWTLCVSMPLVFPPVCPARYLGHSCLDCRVERGARWSGGRRLVELAGLCRRRKERAVVVLGGRRRECRQDVRVL